MTTRGRHGVAVGLRRHRREPPLWSYHDLVLRRYDTADHDRVLELHRAGLAQVGLRPGDGTYYEHDFARMEEIYLRARGEFLVGELGSVVVAMGGLRRRDEEAAEMVRLRVHPDAQDRGYGGAVVSALERRAVELGYRRLHGDTTVRQPAALALYRSLGWRETGRCTVQGILTVYGEKELD